MGGGGAMRDWIEIWGGAFLVMLLAAMAFVAAVFAMPPMVYAFELWRDYWEGNQ